MKRSAIIQVLFVISTLAISNLASAQADDSSNRPLEEVVVTAQKREQNLQDVPISVSVLGGMTLDASPSSGIFDDLNKLGGVSMLYNAQSTGSSAAVRGVTAGDATFAGSSTVGYYIDDLPFGLTTSAFIPDTNGYDLERVEVLRGPQGTLYGAGSLNGVIRVLTKDANLDAFEFKGRTTVSDTEGGGPNYRADVAVSVPLIPGKLAVRGVAGYSDDSGWIDRMERTGNVGKEDANDAQSKNLRLKINYQPSDNLYVKFNSWFSRHKQGAPSAGTDDGFTVADIEEPARTDFDTFGLNVVYDFESFSVQSSTGYMQFTSQSKLDVAGVDTITTGFDSEVFSQEIRASSTLQGNWQWSAGLYYRNGNDYVATTLPIISPSLRPSDTKSESMAVFAEVSRAFMEGKLELTAGLRSFKDEITTKIITDTPPEDANDAPRKYDNVSPRLLLTLHTGDDQMVYASYAEGFRSGFGKSATIEAVWPEYIPPHQDTLDNYEIGIKGSGLGGRVTYEAALFYIDWADVQQVLTIPIITDGVDTGGFIFAPINGDSASGAGLDLAITVAPTDRLTFGLNLGYNDLTMDSQVLSSGAVLFEKGDRLVFSPEYTFGLNLDYEFGLGSSGVYVGHFHASSSYHSELETRAIEGGQLALTAGDDMTVSRLSFSVSSPNHWVSKLFVDNVGNEDGALNLRANNPSRSARIRPLTIGLQVEYRY